MKLLFPIICFFSTLMVGFGAPAGGPVETPNRHLAIQISSKAELTAMERLPAGNQPIPEQQAAVNQFLEERGGKGLCQASPVGKLPSSRAEGQTCTATVWRVDCSNGIQVHATVTDCQ